MVKQSAQLDCAGELSAMILNPERAADRRVLDELRSDPLVEFIDGWLAETDTAEAGRWAYYPWRRTVVGIAGPSTFRRLRLNRNRNLITADEQRRLGELRIGVVGLSAGHAIAHLLAMQGMCAELRVADFDRLELSNLNRVPGTLFDLGVNKATVVARRIAEIDPYVRVHTFTSGVTADNVDEFVDGLDIVIEECDSIDIKVLVREAARARRLPLVMSASDRGLVDVERHDLQSDYPFFHAMLGDVDTALLSDLTIDEKIPHVLNIVDGTRLSAKAAASLVEVGETLDTWPQLAYEIHLGAAVVAEAVRRIGLGEHLPSGRVYVDAATALDQIAVPAGPDNAAAETPQEAVAPTAFGDTPLRNSCDIIELVADAAALAPSAGNAQPWRIETGADSARIELAPEHTSRLDVGLRASAIAVGAATFNARVAAAAHRMRAAVEFEERDGASPLHATVQLVQSEDPHLAGLYGAMLRRETNRRAGVTTFVPQQTAELLCAAARREGARLHLLTGRDELSQAAEIVAAADRIRYLTPDLHTEMLSELRWPGDVNPDSGIDVGTLEFDATDVAKFDIIARPEVMAQLAKWDAGTALGAETRRRIGASSALAMISVPGATLRDYALGGSAANAVWTVAQHRGFAVQPMSPVFIFARSDEELHELSPKFAPLMHQLRGDLRALVGLQPHESIVLLLRLFGAPPASVRSNRRKLAGHSVDRRGLEIATSLAAASLS